MKEPLTLANINIFAILRNLEELWKLDENTRKILEGKDMSIQFIVKNGPRAYLRFKDGACTFNKGQIPCKMKLYFKSPQHLNDMFEGKANPIPLKGLTQINFLKNEFTELTNRLTYFLKPTDELLKDSTYFKTNTILSAYTAFMTLVEIGNSDRIGKLNAKRIPEGVISIEIAKSDIAIQIISDGEGNLEGRKGKTLTPRAFMIFDSLNTANALLNGKIDSFSCIATGGLQMKGYIPMVEYLSKLLAQVPTYLK